MRMPIGSKAVAQNIVDAHISNFPQAFNKIGQGAFRTAYLYENVVYKVVGHKCDDKECVSSEFESELVLFNLLSEYKVIWCPDFWAYEDISVMAMRPYETPSTFWVDILDPTSTNEPFLQEMQYVGAEVKSRNIGYDENGILRLIDGGHADEHHRIDQNLREGILKGIISTYE